MLDNPLSDEADEDIKALLKALEKGRAYIAMEYFQEASGFQFLLSDGDTVATMGDSFTLKDKAVVSIRIPISARIRLIKDGRPCWENETAHAEVSIMSKGTYRVESFLKTWGKFRPWIFSNPIYVR